MTNSTPVVGRRPPVLLTIVLVGVEVVFFFEFSKSLNPAVAALTLALGFLIPAAALYVAAPRYAVRARHAPPALGTWAALAGVAITIAITLAITAVSPRLIVVALMAGVPLASILVWAAPRADAVRRKAPSHDGED